MIALGIYHRSRTRQNFLCSWSLTKLASALNSRTPEIIAGNGHKPAAVLIPIQERQDDDYLVLTQRGDQLPTHKGQIAFPGGRVDAGDKDIFRTALRESEEEIGINPEQVKILGRLDEFTAGYGLVVTPVVGVIPAHYEFRMDPRETTAVASVPIRSLMERPAISRSTVNSRRAAIRAITFTSTAGMCGA